MVTHVPLKCSCGSSIINKHFTIMRVLNQKYKNNEIDSKMYHKFLAELGFNRKRYCCIMKCMTFRYDYEQVDEISATPESMSIANILKEM